MRLNVKGSGYYCPHPVGTWLHCEFDPNGEWPGTAWARYAEGTYLVSAGNTYNALSNYGENAHALTVGEMPSHAHQTRFYHSTLSNNASGNGNTLNYYGYSNQAGVHVGVAGSNECYTGSGWAHNNMPYSVAVPLWRRTA